MRQGSDLWRRAHAGRVSTGSLLAALGWRHEKAAQRIGLQKPMRGNEHLQHAYTHLLAGPDTELEAALKGGPAAGGGPSGVGPAGGGGGGAAANERRRAEFNASLRGAAPPATNTQGPRLA